MNSHKGQGPGEEPYLSMVVASRNDNHGGDALARTQTFLDSLAEQCHRLDFPVELILVDWNPPAERPRLSMALEPPAFSDRLDVRFLEVSADVHRTFAFSGVWPIFQMIAKNAGIRRARGRFVLATNIDILFSEELMGHLSERRLRDDCFYVTDRHDLGVGVVPPNLYGRDLMKYADSHVARINYRRGTVPAGEPEPACRPDYLQTNACGDFTLMARENWERLRGYPEYQLYSIHIDGLLLFAARELGLRQHIFKNPRHIYHIEHGNGWMTNRERLENHPSSLSYEHDVKPLMHSMMLTYEPLSWNEDDWGLRDEPLAAGGFREAASREAPTRMSRIRKFYENRIGAESGNADGAGLCDTSYDLARLEEESRLFEPETVVCLGADVLSVEAIRRGLGKRNARLLVYGARDEGMGGGGTDDAKGLEFPGTFAGLDEKALSAEGPLLVYLNADERGGEAYCARFFAMAADRLPPGSRIIVDNVWFSPQRLRGNLTPFVTERLLLRHRNRLGALESVRGDLHQGGCLVGGSGGAAVAAYVNSRRIMVEFSAAGKRMAFDPRHRSGRGNIEGELLEVEALKPVLLEEALQSLLAELRRTFGSLKTDGETVTFLEKLSAISGISSDFSVAKAVCLLSMGKRDEASAALGRMAENGRDASRSRPDVLAGSGGKNALARHSGLTLFTTCKPFRGEQAVIQRNALLSWRELTPRPDIVLLGDEEGVGEAARTYGLDHVPDVMRDEYGTPVLSDLFNAAGMRSRTEHLAYANADIMLLGDIAGALETIAKRFPKFVVVGRRTEIRLVEDIDFSRPDWKALLLAECAENGFSEKGDAIDYFLFPVGLWQDIPPFAVGRLAWDNWLLGNACASGAEIVDASEYIFAVHQHHDYNHAPGGREWIWKGPEAARNRSLQATSGCFAVIEDAKWRLDGNGVLVEKERGLLEGQADFKSRRARWLIDQCRRLLNSGRSEAAAPLAEELRHRGFAPSADMADVLRRLEQAGGGQER